MAIDIATIGLFISALNFLLTWGVGIYVHISSRNKATNERITRLESDFDSRMDGQLERIAKLEERAALAPSHHDLTRLHQRIDELNGTLKHIEGESKSQTRILNLVYESLINKS